MFFCLFVSLIMGCPSLSVKSRTLPIQLDDSLPAAAATVDDNFHALVSDLCASSCVFPRQALCLEIEQTQQASDFAELERWSKLSSSARDELATLKCILGSMKDNQVGTGGQDLPCKFSFLVMALFVRSVFQVRLVEVEGWLDGVQEMMSRDTAAFGAKGNLQEELSQCKVRHEPLQQKNLRSLLIFVVR